MRRPLQTALWATIAVLGAGQAPAAQERGFYVGANWGDTTFQHEASGFDDGSFTEPGRVDDEDTGWKVYAGYRLGEHLALEGGYTVLNNDFDSNTTLSGATSNGSGSFAAGGVAVDLDRPQAAFVAARACLPLGSRLTLGGKVGAHLWAAEVTTFDSNGISERDETGFDPLVGVGIGYRPVKRWTLRAEYERFMKVFGGDVDMLSLGVVYAFGHR